MGKSSGEDNNRIPFLKKQGLFIACVIVILVWGAIFIYFTRVNYEKEVNDNAIKLAQSAQTFLWPEQIARFELGPDDISRSEYQQIKYSLILFKERNPEIHFAYLYTQRDGKIRIMVDSETPGTADYSPPGQEYTEAASDLFAQFAHGQPMMTEPQTDRWGTWVSALVPIKDQTSGKVIAVFGIDYPAKQWNNAIFLRMSYSAFFVLGVLLSFLGFYRSKNRNKILTELSKQLKDNEELFRTIFEQSPVGIAIGNDMNYISNINPMFEKITGRSKENLVSVSWVDITHPDDLQADLESFSKLKSGEIDGYSIAKRYIKPDGTDVWVNMTIAPLHFTNASDRNHLCIIEDITEHKVAEKALHESERSKSVLLANLPGMAYRCNYDEDWTMQFVSEGCYALTGYKPESLLYNKELSYNDLIDPNFRQTLWNEWVRIIAQRVPFRYEYEITTGAGEKKWVLELGQVIYDEKDTVEALEGIVIDITEQKMREAEIQYLNEHDFLTGLYNRQFFEKEKKRLDTKERLPLSVIIGDINGVRLINDAFGHAEGDRLIIETAKIIKSFCREEDVLARTGGDEFSILMPNTQDVTAFEILQKIKNACAAHNIMLKNEGYSINVSLGYATKETEGVTVDQMEKAAEDYMCNRKILNRKSSHNAILSSIMATLYAKSQETEEHAQRIGTFAKLIGMQLNLPQKSMDELELFAILHDIGKVGIDDGILKKTDKLNDEEWLVMKKHPEIGYRIAMSSSELEPIADYILCHHEHWDGSGYPQGLKGESIPLLSRILAVADAYDAMTKDRLYRKGRTREEAMAEIQNNAGTQFDPAIAQIFIENV